ncbi:MAG: glutathione S-transferase N-terminal domain-containing protein [Chlamydiales bacterium]|nr:glutathione S-transferase N-terminal domain-containing protein [Chlamydiales bacterium]
MKKLLLLSLFACSLFAAEPQKLKLFIKDGCPYCHKVLREMKHSMPTTDIGKNPADRDELEQTGGKAQVPCLFIDGKPLYESDAIIEWLNTHEY